VYPRLLGQAAQNWFRVDGTDKKTKENEILASFRKGRSVTGLIGDALKFARAWR
jgi:electron transfer flavoprotein-quinone oxidoreductase